MEAFKSILYLVSILVTTCTIFLTKKRSEKLNGVSYYFISILFFLCYQVFVRITVNKIGISGSIVTMSIMNYVLSLYCIYLIIKKGIQKYYVEVFDIILMFIIAGIAIYLGGRQFGWHFDYFNYQSSTDCSRHLLFARAIAKDSYTISTVMPFMAINTGLFLEAIYAFIKPYEDVQIFIITDIIMIFFHGNIFFALIRNKLDKNKLLLIIGGAASVFYMMGYPLNNMVFGTSYLGAGMLVSILIFILIDRYENKEIGTKFFLVSIALALVGLLESYQLFFPIVLVGVIVYYINKNIISRNASLQKYTAWILSGLFLACALVIGLYFKFLPLGESITGLLSMAGYMYCSLFGDFIFLLPILVYRIYRCYKTKTWTFDFIMGMFMISYIIAFLYACYLGRVSPYYYYKNYYLFWVVAFYMVMQTASAMEKERLDGIVVYFLSILVLWVFTFGGIESFIEEKSDINGQQINYELHGRALFRLYSWNYDKGRKEVTPIQMSDDIIELYHKVADISISEGEQIQCLNCILFGYFEYYALAYQWELISYDEKQYGSQYMLDKVLNDGDKYTCVIYETCKEIEPETQEYLDTYEKIYENAAGCIYKIY